MRSERPSRSMLPTRADCLICGVETIHDVKSIKLGSRSGLFETCHQTIAWVPRLRHSRGRPPITRLGRLDESGHVERPVRGVGTRGSRLMPLVSKTPRACSVTGRSLQMLSDKKRQ